MKFILRKRQDTWSLRPGDLPPSQIASKEPRLADLNGNPVYHFLLHRRRKRGLAKDLYKMALLIAAFVAIVILTVRINSPWFRPVFILYIGQLIYFIYQRFLVRHNVQSLALLTIPFQVVADLDLAGVSPKTYASAIWARAARRQWRWRRAKILIVPAMIAALVAVFFVPPIVRPFFFALILVMSFGLGNVPAEPHNTLIQCVSLVRSHRRRLEGSVFRRSGTEIGLSGCLTLIVMVVLICTAFVVFAQLKTDVTFNTAIFLPVTILAGGWLGFDDALRARRRAANNFDIMTREIDAIIQFTRKELYEKPAGESKIGRPE